MVLGNENSEESSKENLQKLHWLLINFKNSKLVVLYIGAFKIKFQTI